MERASKRLFEWFTTRFERTKRILIFIGPGNNGGDGLCLARLLAENDFNPELYYVHFTDNTSADWNTSYKRICNYKDLKFNQIDDISQFPIVSSNDVIVDAIFGTGLNKQVNGLPLEIIKKINRTDCIVVAVDIPSGLFGEDNKSNNKQHIIKACNTLTFQLPKLSFMFPENSCYTGNWKIMSIGLHPTVLREMNTPFSYIERKDVSILLKKRKKFDHKGVYGHGLLVAGSYGKMGAAVLSAKAALRSGIGRITCHVPTRGVEILQTAVPEAMVQADQSELFVSEVANVNDYDAIGIGPGIGTNQKVQDTVYKIITTFKKHIVIDADAINILGINKEWLSIISENTILTPHLKEFERIAGITNNSYERLMCQIKFSTKHKCIVVLKGANTSISTPDGRVIFNSTGNPGMATAGSGDVLTGIILSLLSQGYSSENAAVAAVYLHGLAGDIAADKYGFEALIASDIVDNITGAFGGIKEQNRTI